MRVWLIALLLSPSVALAQPAAAGRPRLVAPLSGSRMTSRTPKLRWQTATPGPARVELCRDRACAQPLASLETSDAQAVVKSPLPSGTVFWRVRAGGATSATWELFIGHRSAPVDGVAGQWVDVDGDGHPDAAGEGRLRRGGPAGLRALTLVGDVDGDGFGDAVGLNGQGKLELHRGGPAGLAAAAATTVEAPRKTRTFASSVAGVGDVNGDGYGDVVVGTPGLLEAYVYLGGAAGLGATPALTLTKVSRHEHSSFGVTVGAAGDLDGDGLADFVTTASGNNTLYVFAGGAPLPATEPVLSLFGGGDTQWASAMSGAGDVNGDGYADLVYSFLPDTSGEPAYQLRVAYGSAKGALPAKGSLLPRAVDGYLYAGAAGDVDGDGYDDVFMVPEASDSIYLLTGGPTGLSKAPRALRLAASIASVSAPGDLDGDGFADLIVALKRHDEKGDTSLGTVLLSGGPKGLSPAK